MINCSKSKNTDKLLLKEKNIIELFTLLDSAYNSKNMVLFDTISKYIYKEINENSINLINIAIEIDKSNELKYVYKKINIKDGKMPCILGDLNICYKDSTFVIDGIKADKNEAIQIIKNYINLCDNKDNIFNAHMIKKDTLPYFGIINTCKLIFNFYTEISEKNCKTFTSKLWLYYDLLYEIKNYYYYKINKISIIKFSQQFDELTKDKEVAILNYMPIFIYFDNQIKCYKIEYPANL